jgi:Xaa-Pro aminopeptidase
MGISMAGHARRRTAALKQMEAGSAMLLFGAKEALRNGDAEYGFRQDSDLWYLTGWPHPEVALLLIPGAENPSVLFVQPKDPAKEIWTGIRPGIAGATADFGLDEALEWGALAETLTERLQGVHTLYYSVGQDSERDALVLGAIQSAKRAVRFNFKCLPDQFIQPGRILHEMRLFKGEEEESLLRNAAAITCEAHVEAMKMAAPGVNESELHALIDYTFRKRGGIGAGYTSIVGSGENACILHYIENNSALKAGDLVLIDAGCEFENYTADVTRTFPVSGRFSPAQKAIYSLVLKANEAIIEWVRIGTPFKDLQANCIRILTQGLVDLGLLEGDVETLIKEKAHHPFYMHGVSHYLGLDVHDVGLYSQSGASRPLAQGMVLTVEPGLYIAPDNEDVPAEYRGIGVRIEDDILVGADGPINLTAAIPKSVEAVEAACGAFN